MPGHMDFDRPLIPARLAQAAAQPNAHMDFDGGTGSAAAPASAAADVRSTLRAAVHALGSATDALTGAQAADWGAPAGAVTAARGHIAQATTALALLNDDPRPEARFVNVARDGHAGADALIRSADGFLAVMERERADVASGLDPVVNMQQTTDFAVHDARSATQRLQMKLTSLPAG